MGSPAIGLELGIEGLRDWRLDGLPLSVCTSNAPITC